jgi:hypothetical protein
MILRAVAAAAVLCLLAGCATTSSVRAMSAGADGVTYEFPLGRQDEARRQAMLYCANLGRIAVLRALQPQPDGLVSAAYDCR